MNINGTSGTPGLNVNELFNSGLDSISSKGKDLQAKMTEMLGKDEVSPEDMMALQFEVGQYNAMLESLSSVTKSMTDMMKSLAQRTGCLIYRHIARYPVRTKRTQVPGPHPGCFCVAPSRAWRVGRDDGQGEGAVPFSPFCV